MPYETVAPVCLFAYRRPEHTRQVLDALENSPLASSTALYAFVDGPKGPADAPLVAETARVLESARAFKSVAISRLERNIGLRKSIVRGLDQVTREHDRVIVVEDDIVTSPAFLTFMNSALDRYSDNPEVWHVSGFNEPQIGAKLRRGAAFIRVMHCWGWATWANRWKWFERDPEALVNQFTEDDIFRYNLDGAKDFWEFVVANATGELDTWAAFWYATIFRKRGLCLVPHFSYARNIGFDGSGENCGYVQREDEVELNMDMSPPFPDLLKECPEALERLRMYYIAERRARQKPPTRARGFRGLPRRLAFSVKKRTAKFRGFRLGRRGDRQTINGDVRVDRHL